MDNDEQRDYAEEAYNEALLKEEHAPEPTAPDDLRRDIAEAIRGRYYATSGELADVVMDVLRRHGMVP